MFIKLFCIQVAVPYVYSVDTLDSIQVAVPYVYSVDTLDSMLSYSYCPTLGLKLCWS
jgi:hypothetical protein